MIIANIYLNFDGKCKEAFDFYKLVFGGEFAYSGTFGEMPSAPGMPELSEEFKQRIMHISLPLGGSSILMGSDILPQMGHQLNEGNNFAVSLLLETMEEADKVFGMLADGGSITMPLEKTFWGAYYGQVTDAFGIHWMVNVELK